MLSIPKIQMSKKCNLKTSILLSNLKRKGYRLMKVTNQIWNVMNNRMEWLEEWLKLRQYDIDEKETQFMYVYYCTLRNFMDEKYARIKTENKNQRLVHPLSEQELEEIYNKVGNGFIQFFKNEDIINRLGVIPAEAESLQIGINMKKRRESAERSQEREHRNKRICALYHKGYSEKTLCNMFNLKLRQIQYILAPIKKTIKASRKSTIEELYYGLGQSITTIASFMCCSRDTVYKELGFTSKKTVEKMQSSSELDSLKKKSETKTFYINGVAEQLQILYQERRSIANINEQSVVLDKLLKYPNTNFAIFGSGGTGKSKLLKDYLDSLTTEERNATLVLAPTGISASHIDAMTIHRAFSLNCDIQPNVEITSAPPILDKIKQIIIDEINLTRVDLFDYICRACKYIKDTEDRTIRIIVLGDFGQIKPTTLKEDYAILKEEYPTIKDIYAFDSVYWNKMNFDKNILYYVHRQDNQELIQQLENIKYGNTSAIEWFNNNCNKDFDENAISICTTNKMVDSINSAALNKFKEAEIVEFHAIQKGDISNQEMPIAEVLQLAVGMRVMTTANTSDYQNGSLGTITKINQQSIRVLLDTGVEVNVKRMNFKLEDGKEFQQLPIRLAYAISIHKSEGCTFDKANIVVGKGFFECGQLYVALSRVRTLEGIHLIGELSVKDLKVDVNALKYTVDTETSGT